MVAGPPPNGRPRGLAWQRADATAEPRGMSRSTPEEIPDEAAARTRMISPSLLVPGEMVIFELKPSRWYVAFESLPVGVAGAALVLLAFCVEQLQSVRHAAVVVGMWIIGLRVALALLQWFGRTYVLTDRRILMQSGVFSVVVEAMGLEEIETTFVAQAVAQRALGIGTVFFRPAGGEGRSLAWEHIHEPQQVHGHVIAQIERWKGRLGGLKPP